MQNGPGIGSGSEYVDDENSNPNNAKSSVSIMLGSHLLGPLFLEYEGTIRALERELRAKTQEVLRQAEEMNGLVKENEEMGQRLEI